MTLSGVRLLVAVAVGLGLTGCSTDGSDRPPPQQVLGVHASLRLLQGGDLRTAIADVRAAGVRHVREDLSWDEVEPERGVFDWARYDELFEEAASAGLVVLPILNGVPGWAAAEGLNLPSDISAYARFAGAAVERYGPEGSFWRARPGLRARAPVWFELFNEPYLPGPNGERPNPAHYARLVKAAVAAGRSADSSARFLLAGETYMTADYATYEPWLTALYEAEPDLGEHFDGLAAHPYGSGPPRDYDRAQRDRSQTRRIEELDRILGDRGDGEKPIWITEVGWSTCPAGDECVDEATQAEYLAQTIELARTRWRPFLDGLFVYHLSDYEPRSDDDTEPWFGLRRPDGSEKPAYEVFRDAAR